MLAEFGAAQLATLEQCSLLSNSAPLLGSVKSQILSTPTMIPAGYMAKRIEKRPPNYHAPNVEDIYSVSSCISDDFTDYIKHWKHNGFWLFDSPEIIQQIATDNNISLNNTKLFYYEIYELQFIENKKEWGSFSPEPSSPLNIQPPEKPNLEGYDVVTFAAGTSPECSPLSCNNLAEDIPTNKHCLLSTFNEAQELLNEGKFNNSELGPFRIFAVYSLEWPK